MCIAQGSSISISGSNTCQCVVDEIYGDGKSTRIPPFTMRRDIAVLFTPEIPDDVSAGCGDCVLDLS